MFFMVQAGNSNQMFWGKFIWQCTNVDFPMERLSWHKHLIVYTATVNLLKISLEFKTLIGFDTKTAINMKSA